jgi:cytochrome c oxidase cbb3-type subunit III
MKRLVAVCASFLCLIACGKPKERPILPPDITDFATLFSDNCAGCHGVDGKNGPGRPLHNALYLLLIPRDTLQRTIENGVPGTAMPAWARSQGGPLYPKQVSALVNGIEQNWAKPVNLRSVTLPPYSAENDTGDAAHGKRLFVRDCFMCHGKGAKVGPVTDSSFLALVSNQGLRTSIIIGRPDLGMPDWRFLNLGRPLGDQDIADIIAYLASLRPQNPTENQASGGKG